MSSRVKLTRVRDEWVGLVMAVAENAWSANCWSAIWVNHPGLRMDWPIIVKTHLSMVAFGVWDE